MFNIILTPRSKEIDLLGPVAKKIDEWVNECIEMNDWKLEKLKIEADHVQITVWLDPDISVDQAIKRFKKGMNIRIAEEFPEFSVFLKGKKFWSDGYYVETIGTIDRSQVDWRAKIVECENKPLI